MQKKGFTLIELVMVIVIIGILAAVAIPTFFNLQDEARRAAAKGGLGGLRSGIAIWYAMKATSGQATWPTLGELTTSVMANGVPANPLVGNPDKEKLVGAGTGGAALATTAYGWMYSVANGQIWACSPDGAASGY